MKKSSKFWIVFTLEVIALEIGAYTYAALSYNERLHVLLLTGLLCLWAAIIGIAVTRSKAQAIPSAILVLGIIALSIGFYFQISLGYHERAYAALGIGILGLIGGWVGIIIPRSIATILSGILILGMVVLSTGLYFLTVLGYHGRAYLVLGTGSLCLLGGLIGAIVTYYRACIARQ